MSTQVETKLAFVVWVTALKNLAFVSSTMATAAAKAATTSALAGWATASQAATVGAIAAAHALSHAAVVSYAALKLWTATAVAAAGSGSAAACQAVSGGWASMTSSGVGPLAAGVRGCLQGGKAWVCSAGDAACNLVKGLASGIAEANSEVMVSPL